MKLLSKFINLFRKPNQQIEDVIKYADEDIPVTLPDPSDRTRRKWSPEEDIELVNRYLDAQSLEYIAFAMHRTVPGIKRKLNSLGYTTSEKKRKSIVLPTTVE